MNKLLKLFSFFFKKHSDLEWLLEYDKKSTVIMPIAEHFNISENTVRRLLRNYFQGGMNSLALVPKYINCGKKNRTFSKHKTGPKTYSTIVRDEKIENIFTIMTTRYLTGGAKMSYPKLYEEMVAEFFSSTQLIAGDIVTIPYAVTQRPTLRQLSYWIKTHTDAVERELIRQGKSMFRNNYRPLFSDTIAFLNVKAIGARFEMDEMETDFYLVNRLNRNKPIGRAIVYFIIDVYSRAIVACGIGLDNNSWSGAEMALLNMVEDKTAFCTQYNIIINEKDWPMKSIMPRSIIVDNGSEYLSNNFTEMAKEQGITIDFAPPRMGSFKEMWNRNSDR